MAYIVPSYSSYMTPCLYACPENGDTTLCVIIACTAGYGFLSVWAVLFVWDDGIPWASPLQLTCVPHSPYTLENHSTWKSKCP